MQHLSPSGMDSSGADARVERQDTSVSFVGCGDEHYPKGDITARTAPVGEGMRGEVLPPQVALRLQYGEILQERATHSGCGGEAYLPGEVDAAVGAITPQAIPTRQEIIQQLRDQCLNPDIYFYVSRLINALAGHGTDADLKREVMHAQFPEFWKGKSSLFADQSGNAAVRH